MTPYLSSVTASKTVKKIDSKNIRLNSISFFGVARGFIDCEKDLFHHLDLFTPLFLLLFMFHVPVALIWLKIIPFAYRFFALYFFGQLLYGAVGDAVGHAMLNTGGFQFFLTRPAQSTYSSVENGI